MTMRQLTQPGDEYSPAQIRYWLAGRCPQCRWSMLESAVEGGVSSGASGAGRGERFGLAHLKADLEHAADQLPLHWQSTAFVFSRQHRFSALTQRRQRTPPVVGDWRESEHPVPSQALDDAIWRMARSLGWIPGLTSVA